MDFCDTKEISKVEDRLTEVIAKEYQSACAYANIDKVEISYLATEPGDKPVVVLYIRYGVASENDWQKELKLYYEEDSLDFIAGQFFQALVGAEG